MASTPKCLVCGQPARPRGENPDYPFCSERCRLIDLGNWLGGGYRIPGPPASDADLADALRRRGDGGDDDGEGGGTLH